MFGILIMIMANVLATTADAIRIHAPLGSDVTFPLTSFKICQNLSFSDPYDILLVKVTNSKPALSVHITQRSELDIKNGNEVFILKDVQTRDEGTYFLEAIARMEVECGRVFELYVDRVVSSYWLEWGEWSSCDKRGNCAEGERERTRECSIQRDCHTGNSSQCRSDVTCITYKWTGWTAWSSCSTSCGGGTRRRRRRCYSDTLQKYVNDSRCTGSTDEEGQCARNPCSNISGKSSVFSFEWTSWSSWTMCSVPCDTGWKSRDRKCTDQYNRDAHLRCTGESNENITCISGSCKGNIGSSGELELGSEPVFAVPLSVMVGAGAGVFIIILFIVIIALVLKLRSRRRQRSIETGNQNSTPEQEKKQKTKAKKYKKDKMSEQTRPKSSHIYAEINDDDVPDYPQEKKVSITTIDNTYDPLPRPGSMADGYENTVNFDLASRQPQGSRTYANVHLTVPPVKYNKKRQDSGGYLVPMQNLKDATVPISYKCKYSK